MLLLCQGCRLLRHRVLLLPSKVIHHAIIHPPLTEHIAWQGQGAAAGAPTVREMVPGAMLGPTPQHTHLWPSARKPRPPCWQPAAARAPARGERIVHACSKVDTSNTALSPPPQQRL